MAKKRKKGQEWGRINDVPQSKLNFVNDVETNKLLKLKSELVKELTIWIERTVIVDAGLFLPEEVDKILEQIKTDLNAMIESENLKPIGRYEAFIVFAVYAQEGGIHQYDDTWAINMFDRTISVRQIRESFKTAGYGDFEQKLAMTLGTLIQKVCSTIGINGNVSKEIVRSQERKLFTTQQLAWLSDFQYQNPDCPLELRKLINDFLTS